MDAPNESDRCWDRCKSSPVRSVGLQPLPNDVPGMDVALPPWHGNSSGDRLRPRPRPGSVRFGKGPRSPLTPHGSHRPLLPCTESSPPSGTRRQELAEAWQQPAVIRGRETRPRRPGSDPMCPAAACLPALHGRPAHFYQTCMLTCRRWRCLTPSHHARTRPLGLHPTTTKKKLFKVPRYIEFYGTCMEH